MKKYSTQLISLTALILMTFPVFSQALCNPSSGTYCNPLNSGTGGVTATDIPCFLLSIVDLVFLIGVPIIVMFIIYSGFLFVTAGGNEAKISKARTSFMWTMLGALVLLGAKAIALAVGTTIISLGAGGGAPFSC
ncbi:MAG: hypothetical protein UY04_C0012G0032 [Parcubacteria group bacterium GW2011_GWA2_47_7]|nr:MAG: hypothetical protein UY04_C0012G0032 [Parcubacteria group bacterium GW2011_GWA2_47_7]